MYWYSTVQCIHTGAVYWYSLHVLVLIYTGYCFYVYKYVHAIFSVLVQCIGIQCTCAMYIGILVQCIGIQCTMYWYSVLCIGTVYMCSVLVYRVYLCSVLVYSVLVLASYPVPRPAFRRLQYDNIP